MPQNISYAVTILCFTLLFILASEKLPIDKKYDNVLNFFKLLILLAIDRIYREIVVINVFCFEKSYELLTGIFFLVMAKLAIITVKQFPQRESFKMFVIILFLYGMCVLFCSAKASITC